MEQIELRDWERRCIQEETPYCQAACPIHVDVRAFMERMRAQDVAAARNILEKTMPLPGVLGLVCDHPCQAACKRGEAGGALAIGQLERACVRLGKPGPKPLVLPSRGKRAAVLGGGLASLVCAWDLVRKGHGVTLFCQDARLGGQLLALPEDVLPPAALDREVERLAAMGVVLRTGQEFTPSFLDDVLAGHDAVFAPWGGPLCPAGRREADPVTLAAPTPGVFCGGWPGQGGAFSAIAQAADGRRAAASMDRHMAGASLTASREKEGPYPTRLYTSLAGVALEGPRAPNSPEGYRDAAEAAEEAARCLDCQCLECVKQCTYLKHYKGYPKKYARQIYNNAAIVQGVHQANTMINSCSLCGLCASVCPEKFSMGELCLTARRDMVSRGKMPLSAHDFALEDMAFNQGPAFALARRQPGASQSAYLFYPGCQLAASHPHHVASAYAFLRQRLTGGVGLMLGCCAVPALWAGRDDLFGQAVGRLRADWEMLGRPRMVTACASCLAVFKEHLPELAAVSIWEVFATTGLPGVDAQALGSAEAAGGQTSPATPPARTGVRPGQPVAVHDPCALRQEPGVRAAVRAALGRLGVAFEELAHGGQSTECCGYGGLMGNANPALARKVAAAKASESPLDYVASCAMCRDRLAAEGKRAWHALDFVFDGPPPDPAAPGPGYSDRHERRARLKMQLLREVWGEDAQPMGQQGHAALGGLALMFTPEALISMEQRRILKEDITAVIAQAESTGRKFVDKTSGRFLACHRPRRVTYWAEYSRQGDALTVWRAWSHRMELSGASGKEDS